MKKLSIFVICFLLLGLVACGSTEDKTASEPKEEPKPSEQKEVSNKEIVVEPEEEISEEEEIESSIPEVKKDEDGNYILDTVGQVLETPRGMLELMKIKEVNEIVDISPIKVTIESIKLFKLTDIPTAVKNDLSYFNNSQSVGDELHYIQIAYNSENIEDKNIDWYGIEKVVLSNGQQLDAMINDFVTSEDDLDNIFYGKVKKTGVVGLIYKGDPAEISSVKIILSHSIDSDSYDTITEQQQVEYEL